MDADSRIYVAGHGGLVGGALCRRLQRAGFERVLTRTRAQLDLRDQRKVDEFFATERPQLVFLAAATVGGIYANSSRPADFIRDNLQIATNVIDAAHRNGVEQLVFLGSSCIYPRLAPQPIAESALLTGALESTNEWYAIAKIAGLKMCQAYRRQYGFNAISVMPTNLYGPHDNFDPHSSHVLPALLRRFHEAAARGDREVVVWGSGEPRREFLHVDDFADACLYVAQHYTDEQPINIGCGQDVKIAELAATIGDVVGFRGDIVFDTSKPDGTPRKLLDVSRLQALGWQPRIGLRAGIEATHRWYVDTYDNSEPRVLRSYAN